MVLLLSVTPSAVVEESLQQCRECLVCRTGRGHHSHIYILLLSPKAKRAQRGVDKSPSLTSPSPYHCGWRVCVHVCVRERERDGETAQTSNHRWSVRVSICLCQYVWLWCGILVWLVVLKNIIFLLTITGTWETVVLNRSTWYCMPGINIQ